MLLSELLRAEHILVPLNAANFNDGLHQLVRRLADAGAIKDVPAVERALKALRGRELVSIGDRVALPHFRTDAVDELVLALGIARLPLDAAETSLTADPQVIALVLAPPEAAIRYLQTVAALARLFRDPGVIDRLAVAESAADVLALAELGQTPVQPELRVRDVMAHRTEGVSPATTVRDAVDLMLRHGWRALPVIGAKGEVLGILTEWDVMQALLPEIPRIDEGEPQVRAKPVLVKDAMTRSVLCVSEEMGLEEAANMMVNKNIEQFPVVSESALTGILSRGDIIRKLFGR